MTVKRNQPVILSLDGDNMQLANLCGPLDENLRQIAQAWGVKLGRNGNRITIEGERAREAGNTVEIF
ncbi:MAG: PhoH family protein, partial [Alcaligenaceae bacterium]|nr:PhoH family protein [Alcaligenaceae bacterium]